LESSPEVLTCSRMLSAGLGEEEEGRVRAALSAEAAFWDVSVWSVCRFEIEARVLALLDWRVPMKCHRISSGS
jgi:hypothetical protein